MFLTLKYWVNMLLKLSRKCIWIFYRLVGIKVFNIWIIILFGASLIDKWIVAANISISLSFLSENGTSNGFIPALK